MKLRNISILIVVLVVILAGLLIFTVSINLTGEDNKINEVNKVNKTDSSLSSGFTTVNLGSNDMGSVDLIGPIGNKNSNIKIAYIIGVHPLESNVHNALYNSIISKDGSLNYCYYIYKINVTKAADDYDVGRMNGQLLAKEFVVPDASSKGYNLVVDIHSNQGTAGGSYEETNFIFAPLNNPTSKTFADKIIAKIPPLVYYFPKSQTSPEYVTVPIINSGTPAIVYETYRYESNEITVDYINKLINIIDNLKFK